MVAIGSPSGEGIDCHGGGWSYGPNAEDYPFDDVPITRWKIGDEVEVGWGLLANHGGGYSYRLLKFPEAVFLNSPKHAFNRHH